MKAKSSLLQRVFLILVLFCVYFLAAKFGLKLAFVNASATAVWPPTGIAIASFLLFGTRVWPAILLGAFLANLTTAGTIYTSVAIALGNTLEGFLGAYLINRLAGGRYFYYQAGNIFLFSLLVGIATAVSATIGVLSLTLTGFASWTGIGEVWLTWWLGDMAGGLVLSPLLLIWSEKEEQKSWQPDSIIELVLLVCALIIVSVIIFTGIFPQAYIAIPFLLWAAFRFGPREVSLATVALSAIAIWGTLHSQGPFIGRTTNDSLLLLQAFLIIISITILALASVLSERKKIQERFQRTLDNMVEGFQIIGFDWKYLYVNDAVARQGRMGKKQLLGHTMMEMYPGIEKTEAFSYFKRCMEERTAHHMENEFSYPNGEKNWFELRIEPISEGILILSVDIDERKKTQQRITREKAEDEALLSSIGEGIIATDNQGNIILINAACEDLLGFDKKEVIGKKETELITMLDEQGNNIPDADRPLSKALQTGKKVTTTKYLLTKHKTRFPALITATPILLKGQVLGAVKVFHDITQEKEIDRMKTEFISFTSHELRTPMTAIKGFISMIQHGDYGPVNPRLIQPLSSIAISTQRLIDLVNDMLNISQIEAGKLTVHLHTVMLQPLLEKAVASLTPLATKKKLVLRLEGETTASVLADDAKTEQILNNIIGNAIKFTDKGEVVIATKQKQDSMIIYITDTGAGIGSADQKRLFEKFEQISSEQAGRPSGTGLGLYISKELAQKMRGDLWIEKSSLGKGTTFAFSLPIAKSSSSQESSLV